MNNDRTDEQLRSLRSVPAAPDAREAVMACLTIGKRRVAFSSWKVRALITVPVLAIIIVLAVLQPWSTPLGPEGMLAEAHAAIDGIESYRFSVTRTNESGATTGVFEVAYVSPDNYHVFYDEDGTTREFIIIGDDFYYRGEYDQFAPVMYRSDYYNSMISKEATLEWFDRLKDVEDLGKERIDDVQCRHYLGEYDYEAMLRDMMTQSGPQLSEEQIQEMLEEQRAQTGTMTVELWIGEDDYLTRKIVLQRFPPETSESEPSTITYRYYDFNAPFTIDPPRDVAGNLLPGWLTTTPDEPAFSADVSVSIDNYDPTNRIISYNLSLTNVSGNRVDQITMMTLPFRTPTEQPTMWMQREMVTEGIYGNGPYRREAGETLDYVIRVGYDATRADPVLIAESIEQSGAYVSYVTPDGSQRAETIPLPVPDGIYTLPTVNPNQLDLTPVGEYRIDEEGAQVAGPAANGQVGGREYAFVEVKQDDGDVAAPGILALDVTDPSAPVKADYLPAEGADYLLTYMQLSETTLYAATDAYLWILDVSDPADLRELGRYDDIKPGSFIRAGDYLYVEDGNWRVLTLDVSNPAHPVQVSAFEISRPNVVGTDISGDYLMVWSRDFMHVIDISDPASPVEAASHRYNNLPDGLPATSVWRAYDGTTMFLALIGDETTGILAVDFSDSLAPVERDFLELKGRLVMGPVYLANDRLYINTHSKHGPGLTTRLTVLDVGDPDNLRDSGLLGFPATEELLSGNWGAYHSSYSFLDGYLYQFLAVEGEKPVMYIYDLGE